MIFGMIIVIGVALFLSLVISNKDEKVPPPFKKIKAAGMTYSKYVVINQIAPTVPIVPSLSDKGETGIEILSSGDGVTPVPTDINLVVTPVITNSNMVSNIITPTISITATTQITALPTKVPQLLESGSVGFSLGLLIFAVTFISVAFLL